MDAVGDDNLFWQGDTGNVDSTYTTSRKYYESLSSPSIWYWLMRLLDFFTCPSFGVLAAVAAIIILHYKSPIMDFYSNLVENGIQETMTDSLLSLCDLARAYYQIACEVIRNLCSSAGAHGPVPSIPCINTTLKTRTSSMSTPPPLVMIPLHSQSVEPGQRQEIDANEDDTSAAGMQPLPSPTWRATIIQHDRSSTEIEPAFLNDTDYPEGWLVYHPKLGVIPKEEADRFDRNTEGPTCR